MILSFRQYVMVNKPDFVICYRFWFFIGVNLRILFLQMSQTQPPFMIIRSASDDPVSTAENGDGQSADPSS